MSRRSHAPPLPRPLCKQQSWSPDMLREEAWQRQRDSHINRGSGTHHRLSKSLSEYDLQELKACIELGFGFDSPEIDPKLCNTIPALELYHAVNKQYNNHSLSRSSSSSSLVSDSDITNPTTIFDPGNSIFSSFYSIKKHNPCNLIYSWITAILFFKLIISLLIQIKTDNYLFNFSVNISIKFWEWMWLSIFFEADDLAAKKTRLKQWAQVVACAVRQSSPSSGPSPSDQAN